MTHPPLSADQRRHFERAASLIDEARLRDMIVKLTAIHSPTGAERAASQFMAVELAQAGLAA
ncbi:MAG: acetylornithine deacetylase, partial [Alphaproteobacteria bacterium]|nr:acetylornithine deacetylase [Alphaproteobacteria bacterium]